ncbi:MAG: hypothetical protein QOF90_1764 [Acetobacteraceae bacterium]|jgi:hypothetical protein|nr:hypothetical protein [Acetobacteraceae bacterium]
MVHQDLPLAIEEPFWREGGTAPRRQTGVSNGRDGGGGVMRLWPLAFGSLTGQNFPKTRAEDTVADNVTNLEQQIGASPRPPHLLIQPAVYPGIGGQSVVAAPTLSPVRCRSAYPGITLSDQIAVQCVQDGPRLSRKGDRLRVPGSPLMHDRVDAADADPGVGCLCRHLCRIACR